MTELKQCPLCLLEPVLDTTKGFFCYYCGDCGDSGSICRTEEEAAKTWNAGITYDYVKETEEYE